MKRKKTDYTEILNQLIESNQIDNIKFEKLYDCLLIQHNVNDGSGRIELQEEFANSLKSVAINLPRYYNTIRRLVRNDELIDSVKQSLIEFIDTNISRKNIHNINFNVDQPDILKAAIIELSEKLSNTPKQNSFNTNVDVLSQEFVLDNVFCAEIIEYINRTYLLLSDKNIIRVVDFESRKQVTCRYTEKESNLIIANCINSYSPVHFVTYSNNIIQAWHLNNQQPYLNIEVNARKVFLCNEGLYLVIITDQCTSKNKDVSNTNLSFTNCQSNVAIVIDTVKKQEYRRFSVEANYNTIFNISPDTNHLYVANSKSEHQKPVVYNIFSDSLTLWKSVEHNISVKDNFTISPDSSFLITNSEVYTLPSMKPYIKLKSSSIQAPYVSKDGKYIALVEHDRFLFFELETGICKAYAPLQNIDSKVNKSFFDFKNRYFFSCIDNKLYGWNFEITSNSNNCLDSEIKQLQNTDKSNTTFLLSDTPVIAIHKLVEQKANNNRARQNTDDIDIVINNSFLDNNSEENNSNDIPFYQNPNSEIKFSRINCGVYKVNSRIGNTEKDMANIIVDDNIIDIKGTNIEARKGVYFGVNVNYNGNNCPNSLQIKVKVKHPEIKDELTGHTYTETCWLQQVGKGMNFFAGWKFEKQEELKEGVWKFEFYNYNETIIYAHQSFNVITTNRQKFYLHKEFSGEYNAIENNNGNNFIVADYSTLFGIKYTFNAPNYEGRYRLCSRITPPLDSKTDFDKNIEENTHYLAHGDSIELNNWHNAYDKIIEGKWCFTILDGDNKNEIINEEFQVISAYNMPKPEIEIIDFGQYSSSEKQSIKKSYPSANLLTLEQQNTSLKLAEDMIFGFRIKITEQHKYGYKFTVHINHPTATSIFGQSSHFDYQIFVLNQQEYFVGYTINKQSMMLLGEWTISLWYPNSYRLGKLIKKISFNIY